MTKDDCTLIADRYELSTLVGKNNFEDFIQWVCKVALDLNGVTKRFTVIILKGFSGLFKTDLGSRQDLFLKAFGNCFLRELGLIIYFQIFSSVLEKPST